MGTVKLFNLVLTTLFILRTARADSFTKKYMEEDTAYLTCSSEFNEIMKIATIKYEKGTCSHKDLHGIGNLCNWRTECTFDVTNSNVGSSCGANGTASLEVTYSCIRNGGWSEWKNATTSCPVNCGGALQNVTRTCTNPTPNEFGASCSGTNFHEQICNDNACPLRGTLCKDNAIVWTCQNGFIQMIRARWKASNGCGEPGSISNFDVVREMKEICNERKSCIFTARDNTFKLSCKEQFKTCSQLEYEYICKDAKWNSWTKWSLCSKSCGTGEQIRTRNCSNQFYTTDGYFVDCEGSSVETRVCNTNQCPYCNNNIFPHHIPSNRKLKKDVSSNNATTDIYKIGCCGTVNAFKFISMNTGEIKFIVWRRVRGRTYKAIKKIAISVTDQSIGKYVQHNLTKYERIAVVRDDIVGWYDGGKNIIGYYDCSPINHTCLAYSLIKQPVNDGDEIDTDGLPFISDKIFAWTFSTAGNTAVDLSFVYDSTEIPDNSAVDTYVTHIRIENPDQGDFIENIELDYDNKFFYFDTKLRNVYVKNILPHTVGQKFYHQNITITVQDSCYNKITANVTIITYNVPPVISGLQNCLKIDPAIAQRAPYLTVFNVKDPSGDNVTCMINKTKPPTELFYLQLINIDAYLKLVNGMSIRRDSTSQYILTIICDDGTENTELDLKIQFQPQNEDAIVKMFTEGERAYVTCSVECNETIDIKSINYTHGPCSHSETYGIRNLCNGQTECSFDVSNSNIGSSCGANGTAMLKVEYNCIRNGGWSGWTTASPCTVMCGGGYHNVTRTCSNPYQNEIGSTCKGEAFDEQTCNTHDCVVQNTACLNEQVNWNCPNGHIEVIKAEWETSKSCDGSYLTFVSYNAINRTKMNCENRRTCSFIANDHYVGESCSTLLSRCTAFKFVYVCVKATWDDWSSWSVCTRSCGTGIQTRHRECLNQMNTTDGYVADCNGIGSNSRSCNTEQCPYCGDKNFLNALPGSDLKEDTSPGSGVLHLNGISTVNCCGRIQMWEFIPVKTGSLTFVILRKTNGLKYKCVGSNIVHISALDLHTPIQFDVADSERIIIIQGDIIGWFGSGNNIGYYDCITTTKACPLSLRLNDPVDVGDLVDVDRLSNLSNRIYALNYSTTEDRPVTIDISSQPVTIPDHLELDSFVMTIPISDPDYGDYIQDFKLDYKNEYFYLDTKQRSVHVKKTLPHVVGHPNATLNFTCTVQDSCFNMANITINFISLNVPPVVTGLPDVLSLDPQQLPDSSRFHIFNVEDPSNDNVSCGLNKISPSTEKFILEIDGNEAFLRVFNHSTSNSTLGYELEICCDDGTDETIFKLIVHFSSKKNSQTNTSESAELKIIFVCGSICGLLLIVISIVVSYCFSKRGKTLITTKSSNGSIRNSWYTSTIHGDATVNPYDDLEQIGDKQIPTNHFELSKPDTNIYENTKIFI